MGWGVLFYSLSITSFPSLCEERWFSQFELLKRNSTFVIALHVGHRFCGFFGNTFGNIGFHFLSKLFIFDSNECLNHLVKSFKELMKLLLIHKSTIMLIKIFKCFLLKFFDFEHISSLLCFLVLIVEGFHIREFFHSDVHQNF